MLGAVCSIHWWHKQRFVTKMIKHIWANFLPMAGQNAANERRRCICKVFPHWPRTSSAIDGEQTLVLLYPSFTSDFTHCTRASRPLAYGKTAFIQFDKCFAGGKIWTCLLCVCVSVSVRVCVIGDGVTVMWRQCNDISNYVQQSI